MLNLVWIPAYRESGAAAATLASEAVVACAYGAALMKAGMIRIDPRAGLKFLLAVAALLLPVLLVPGASVWSRGAAGAGLYLTALVLLRVVSAEDLARLRGLLASPGGAA